MLHAREGGLFKSDGKNSLADMTYKKDTTALTTENDLTDEMDSTADGNVYFAILILLWCEKCENKLRKNSGIRTF